MTLTFMILLSVLSVFMMTHIVIALTEDVCWPNVWDKLSGIRIRFNFILWIYAYLVCRTLDDALAYWGEGHFMSLPEPYEESPAHKRFYFILYDFVRSTRLTFSFDLCTCRYIYLNAVKQEG